VTGPRLGWRRILSVAVCYAVALQAFLAAFETTVAVSIPRTPDAALIICHGADDTSPSTGGTGNSEKLPVCRQSISDSLLGNLRECLAHLV
jgi:hypothetical protein